MPSTQSDAAQVKVLEDFPQTIFLSVETSADAEVNVKSRIQMKLFEAKKVAQKEFEELKSKYPQDVEKILLKNKNLKKPFVKLSNNYIGIAARVVAGNLSELH